MSNPYFKTGYQPVNNENDLYRNASKELCEMVGIDMLYLPRTMQKVDYILGDNPIASFDKNITVTFMIENYTAYEGSGDLFSKFGFQLDDQLVLVVEQNHFFNLVGENPKVGDLIYYEHGSKIFEISNINYDEGLNQFQGGQISYKLTCTLFENSHEDFNTGINKIDDTMENISSETSDEFDQMGDEIPEYLTFDVKNVFGDL